MNEKYSGALSCLHISTKSLNAGVLCYPKDIYVNYIGDQSNYVMIAGNIGQIAFIIEPMGMYFS